jgi:hypothetical protein
MGVALGDREPVSPGLVLFMAHYYYLVLDGGRYMSDESTLK